MDANLSNQSTQFRDTHLAIAFDMIKSNRVGTPAAGWALEQSRIKSLVITPHSEVSVGVSGKSTADSTECMAEGVSILLYHYDHRRGHASQGAGNGS